MAKNKNKTKVRTICVVYATEQKHQKRKFTKIPVGTIGTIRHKEVVNEFNIMYYLVVFRLNGRMYWSKLSPNTFTEALNESQV